MTFKNKRGEMPWYVIGLILAVVVLVVSLFVIPKIKDAQTKSGESIANACTLVKGTCQKVTAVGADNKPDSAKQECTSGDKIPALCPDDAGTPQICCKS